MPFSAQDQLALARQPIVDLHTSEPLLDELLLRITDRHGRPHSPAEYLRDAEAGDRIRELDRWVLGRAFALLAAGRAVSINVSARTIEDDRYALRVAELLREHETDPSLLTFEVTETALVGNWEQARWTAIKLDELGCRLAIDDFGTGHCCLRYLKEFPVHYLKIDREFVADVATNWRSRAIVGGIVGMAQSFGQLTIAEGIEDAAALAPLRELGVDFGQGFLIGRPLLSRGDGIEAKPPLEATKLHRIVA